jgi:predicted RNA binding protein YcfA (HicA-like mRNA interferase family)
MPISGKQVVKVLRKHGFEVARQRGSHIVLRKKVSNGKRVAVVPAHKELRKGTLRSIAKQSGLSNKEFGI